MWKKGGGLSNLHVFLRFDAYIQEQLPNRNIQDQQN